MKNAIIVENQHNGNFGILCRGTLEMPPGNDVSVADFIRQNNEFSGIRIFIDDIKEYKYLFCYGKKLTNHGQPSIYIYDDEGKLVGQVTAAYMDLDGEWHQYMIDVSSLKGKVEIVFQGGYIDSSGSVDSEFVFSEIALY